MSNRVSWDEYFMSIAKLVATRSTCMRRQVGCVIVKDKRIIASGYNGAPSGVSHCTDKGICLRKELNIPSGQQHEKCWASHSESNAITQCARYGVPIDGSVLYCTTHPCSMCAKTIINSGITRVYYIDGYPDDLSDKLFKEAKISRIKLDM